jgi:hypothetical protein
VLTADPADGVFLSQKSCAAAWTSSSPTQNLSPKADRTMWVKIAAWASLSSPAVGSPSMRSGLPILEVYRPLSPGRPRADLSVAQHRPRQQPQRHLVASGHQQDPELRLRCLRNQLLYVAHPPPSGPPLLHQPARRRRRAYRPRHLPLYAARALARAGIASSTSTLFLYALFSLDYVFVRDFECFFFPKPMTT